MRLSIYHRPSIPALTGLRFFAAAAIFILHARDHDLVPTELFSSFDLSQAVTLFFALSGFVISYAYFGRDISIFDFYRARICRVFPGLLISILFVIFILPSSLYLPNDNTPLSPFAVFIVCSLGLQSWIPIPSIFFAFNAVTWSISVEVFFYMLFPFFNKLSTINLCRLFLVLVLTSFLFAYLVSISTLPGFGVNTLDIPVWEGLVYVNPLLRVPEFMIGILAFRFICSDFFVRLSGQCYFNRSRIYSTLSGIFASISILLFSYLGFQNIDCNLNVQMAMLLNRLLSAVSFSFAIALISLCQGPLVHFLSRAQFLFLGEVSYGIYLYHQPLMIRAAQAGGLEFAGIQILPKDWFLILVCTVGFASISFYYLELPVARFFRNK